MREAASQLLQIVLLKKGRIAAIVLVGVIFSSIFLPNLLGRYLCSGTEQAMVQQAVQLWRSQTAVDLPLDFSTNPAERDYSLGSATAPITVVEFSDFECPHCKLGSLIIKTIVAAYPGKVRAVFKNFPLDSSCNQGIVQGQHRFACRAAVLARCAGEHGEDAFWRAHDAIFSVQPLSDPKLQRLPEMVHLDAAELASCAAGDRAAEKIRRDAELGTKLRLQGTPAIFINGKFLPLPWLSAIRRVIDTILLQSK